MVTEIHRDGIKFDPSHFRFSLMLGYVLCCAHVVSPRYACIYIALRDYAQTVPILRRANQMPEATIWCTIRTSEAPYAYEDLGPGRKPCSAFLCFCSSSPVQLRE